MKRPLLDYLVCPETGDSLTLEVNEEDRYGEIKTGKLHSAERIYPIRRWVPRFVDYDLYATTFSRQRQLARKHLHSFQHDDHERMEQFLGSTGFDLADVDGLTLDAGCGRGQFLPVIDDAGGEVIGVDLSSDSVDLAFDYAGRRERVHIVQADLTKLPFRKGQFRRIFSIGVLHHTPDTRSSFERLLPYLEANAEIAIWVYAPEKKLGSNRWRKLTTKLPLGLVYAWCIVNEALLAPMRTLPRGGGRFTRLVPGGSLETPFWERVLSDFDDLTPCFAHTHRADEVREWFAAAGLLAIEVLPRPTAVRGRAPQS
jgi:SAM-dependent methyltransferase